MEINNFLDQANNNIKKLEDDLNNYNLMYDQTVDKISELQKNLSIIKDDIKTTKEKINVFKKIIENNKNIKQKPKNILVINNGVETKVKNLYEASKFLDINYVTCKKIYDKKYLKGKYINIKISDS